MILTDRILFLTTEEKSRIIHAQGGCCIYCGLPFNVVVERHGSPIPYITLQIEFDHFTPVTYNEQQFRNVVASCHICNRIKSDQIFDDLLDAQAWILTKWIALGYRVYSAKGIDACWNCPILHNSGRYRLLFGDIIIPRHLYEAQTDEDNYEVWLPVFELVIRLMATTTTLTGGQEMLDFENLVYGD